mgnify:CR=1 FL=1
MVSITSVEQGHVCEDLAAHSHNNMRIYDVTYNWSHTSHFSSLKQGIKINLFLVWNVFMIIVDSYKWLLF